MELRQRRLVARIVRFGLVALAIILVVGWMLNRVRPDHVRVASGPVELAALGPGDLRVFNEDSTVEVTLVGDQLSAGLSAKLVAQIRAEMADATADESGIGGSIARMVTDAVGEHLDMRVTFPVREIDELRYDDGRLIVHWTSGKESALLGNLKVDVDDSRTSNRFTEAEAERLIAAVRARQRELRQ